LVTYQNYTKLHGPKNIKFCVTYESQNFAPLSTLISPPKLKKYILLNLVFEFCME